MNFFSRFFCGFDNKNEPFEEVYEVGKPFPKKRNKTGDGNVFTYIGGLGPCIISYYTNPSNDEIVSRQHGAIEIGLVCHKDAVYVLGRFGRDYTEGPFNIHLEKKEVIDFILQDESEYMHAFLVDADTHILKAARTLQMTPYFAKCLRESIKHQYENFSGMEEYNATCNQIMSSFELPELFQLAPVKFFARSTAEDEEIMRREAEQAKTQVDVRGGVIHILITKQDVDENRVEALEKLFFTLLSSKYVKVAKQNVILSFCGYGTDVREVYEIPEVRAFVKEIDKKFPYWFYIMNLEDVGLKILFHSMCDAEKVGTDGIKINPSLANEFFEYHLGALYYLTEKLGASEEETEILDEAVKAYFSDYFKENDKIDDQDEDDQYEDEENNYEEEDDDEDYYDEDEDVLATDEELKAEAIQRLRYCDQMEPFIVRNFINEGKVYLSEREGILYSLEDNEAAILREVEAKVDGLVYHVLHYATSSGEMYAFLYVHRHKIDWRQERENMKGAGICYCYAYNVDEPRYSESGTIGVVQVNGGLMKNNSIFGRPL